MAATLIAAPSGRHVSLDAGQAVSFVTPSYLGLERHPFVVSAVARAVHRWGVSTATPRALLRDPLTAALEHRVAGFVHQPAALVFASSRHAACDVLPALAGSNGTLCLDSWAYPTSVDGAREAQRHGARVAVFRHGDISALDHLLRRAAGPKVIVTDGVHAAGGAMAPLAAFADAADRYAAVIYMDDSHGIGVLGRRVHGGPPFGLGGGGLLPYSGVTARRIIVAGTLTKALGAPVAFVAGNASLLRHAADRSASFVHHSPPSIPNVAAALAALAVQDREGNRLRQRLSALVRRFRAGLQRVGLEPASRSLFPIQTVAFTNDQEQNIGAALLRRGIWPLVLPRERDERHVLRFFLTALHTPADIDLVVDALSAISRAGGRARARRPPARHARPHRTSQTAAASAS